MLTTTGLLSLNIHDSLTFDGCELCLHPDLFHTEIGGSSLRSTSQQANNTNNKISSEEKGGTAGGASTASGTTSSQQSAPSGLAVGDMIEIRVWDPLPKEAAYTLKSPGGNSASSSIRKTHRNSPAPPMPNNSSNSIHVEFSAIPTSSQQQPTTTVAAATAAVNLRARSNSLQYSVESDHPDNTNSNNNADANENSTTASSQEKDRTVDREGKSTASATGDGEPPPPPTKTVTTTTNLLPPVFPRARANTSDHATKLPKPMMIHRRAPSFPSVSSILPQSPKISRHTRVISDMTIDTHQLDLIDMLQPVESHDDMDMMMDNDTWSKVSTGHKLRLSFVLLVTEKTLTSLKGAARNQISMLRQISDLYSLSSYDMVTVHKIEPQDEEEVLKAVSADFVVVTIKDQFISRGDMHSFQNHLIGSSIYEGQRLSVTTRGIKGHAKQVRHGNYAAKSGIVTEETMITFRSRSARIIWLVQLSSEMWEYASPYEHEHQEEAVCEIYFDQWVRFIYKSFQKWKELEVTHSLTVVFFSRTFCSNGKSSLNCRDVYGRRYEDHYKPVVENETCVDWESLVVRIKEEFIKYPIEVGWNLTDRRPSSASQGNVLEAINVTLNVMQFHYLDRDLHRTGNSIVVISPGCGVFEVDKGLAGITYQRMMDNGIGSDMLSLGLPPLHIAPFFLYNNEFRTVESRGVDTSETYYEVPHWMHLSFISYDREEKQAGDPNNKFQAAPSVAAKSTGLDLFEVGANGFLRPKVDPSKESGSPRFGPKSPTSSFSAVGNAAATPGKAKTEQERQLISGRDFRDILEACAPRLAGTRMPSSLVAMLKMKQIAEDMEKARLAGTEYKMKKLTHNDKDDPLREWGTVDFNEFRLQPKSKSSRSNSPSTPKGPQENSTEKSDGSESGSNSSFASHMSSMFGVSYDRVLWDHFEPPCDEKNTVQIQRSPSLEFDKVNLSLSRDSDTALSDETLSLGTENVSRSSMTSLSGADPDWTGDNDTAASRTSKRDRHIEDLRKLMEAHDAQLCAPITAKGNEKITGEANPSKPDSLHQSESELTSSSRSGVRQQSFRSRGKESSESGGLGAALSQYSGATDGRAPQQETHGQRMTRKLSSNFLAGQILPAPTGFQQEIRHRSSSPFYPASQFHERNARPMSPMLFPPTTQGNQVFQRSDPPDNLRPEETSSAIHRPVPIDRNPAFLPRDGLASLGILSGSNYELGGVVHKPVGASSFTNFEGNRQRPRPTSRSPPTPGFARRPSTRSAAYSPPNTGIVRGSSTPRVVAASPPNTGTTRDRSTKRSNSREIQPRQPLSRRKKACNPFRQSDEDEVLAKRSHNRRRWSHVFPVGEVEFKRHSGPIWNSLTAPAILPLSVDYFPSPQELRDESTFQFNPYTVTLGGMDKKHYSTHAELLTEMVRQRVSQDFQIVTAVAVKESESRVEPQRQGRKTGKPRGVGPRNRDSFVPSLPTIKHHTSGTIKHYLSMGHRIQVLSYDPSSDSIEIVHYSKKSAHNDPMNIYTYKFLLFSKATEQYSQGIQTFKKYSEPYKWNQVDNLICGEEERTLEEGMRFRRVMFGLIPGSFKDIGVEQDYISKFRRLVEYLGKLREKEDSKSNLDIEIVSSVDEKEDRGDKVKKARRGTSDSMIKFNIQLKKGKRDPFEWLEIAVDSIFDTASSYRIMINWLVASSSKVETQIQLLHRRCTQFGLELISFPQTIISDNIFLHAFAVPTLICIRDKAKAEGLEEALKTQDFIYDGIEFTDSQFLECIDKSVEYDFPKYRSGKIKSIPARQYVHRSGALFIRDIRDRQGWVILAGIENYRHACKENGFREIAKRVLDEVAQVVRKLNEQGCP